MKWFLEHTVPCAHIFEIATKFDDFEFWLKKEHNKEIDHHFFLGYRYFIYSTFTHIFQTIAEDENLGIKNDLLLNSAIGTYQFIMKLPSSSKKTKLLQNIYIIAEPIKKAQDFATLKLSVKEFQEGIIEPIKEIYANSYRLKKTSGLSNKTVTNLLIAEALYLYYHQIKGYGPLIYSPALMENPGNRLVDKNYDNFLEGFKYTVQFVWYKLLGEKVYRKKCTKDIHTVANWNKYIYNEPIKKTPELSDILNRTFDINKQTCYDAIFYRLKDELMLPLEKRYKYDISLAGKFEIINKKYPKEAFKKLLHQKTIYQIKVAQQEVWDMQFFWDDVEVINNYNPHTYEGLATFTTLLAGAGTLFKRNSGLDKVYVNKYVSPIGYKAGNEVSYAILIDSPNSIGYGATGWFLFYHCTREFPRNTEKEVDNLIKKLRSKRILKLRTFNVNDEQFKNYILKYVSNHRNNLLTGEMTPGSFEYELEKKKQQNFVKDSKAIILELISYYVATKHYKTYEIDWSREAKNKSGEMDIILYNETEAFLIECKVNINTSKRKEVIRKSKNKLNNEFPGLKHKIEIWSWVEATSQTKAELMEGDISCISLSTDRNLEFLQHLRLNKIQPLLDK